VAERIQQSGGVPPPGEAIHLPGPSYLPVIVALGTTIAIVGVVLSWLICGAGVLIALIAILRWIGDTRRDIADLPLEHRS
jgi:type IV secretory pathway TrbD component